MCQLASVLLPCACQSNSNSPVPGHPVPAPEASTSKPASRNASQPRSSVPAGRALASSVAIPSRSPSKRIPSRQGKAEAADSIRLLTQQASVATAALRRERAVFTGALHESGRGASTSPVKRNVLGAKTQEARTEALFRYISRHQLLWTCVLAVSDPIGYTFSLFPGAEPSVTRHFHCRDPPAKRSASETSQFRRPEASQTLTRPLGRTSPQKALNPLLGKAHTSAAAVSKILQIAQLSEQRQINSSNGVTQESPPESLHHARPSVSQHQASSSAHVENQRATYPGMSAFEDELVAGVYQSSPARGPPKLYSNLAPTSLSTPGNAPGVNRSSRLLTSGRRTQTQAQQGTNRPSSPEARLPSVFARLAGGSRSPPPVLAQTGAHPPEQSVHRFASPASSGRQSAHLVSSARHGRAASAYNLPLCSSLATGVATFPACMINAQSSTTI